MWEDVKSDGNGPNVRRLTVPGGWLYGTYYAKTEHYVFVPAPAQPEFPTEYNRGFCDGFHGHEPQPLGDKVGAPGDYKDYKHNTQYIYDATTQTFDLAAVQEPVCDRCEGKLYGGDKVTPADAKLLHDAAGKLEDEDYGATAGALIALARRLEGKKVPDGGNEDYLRGWWDHVRDCEKHEGAYPKYLVGCVGEALNAYTDYVPITHGLFGTRAEAEAYLATVVVGRYPFIVQLDKPLYDRKVTKGVKADVPHKDASYDEVIKLLKSAADELDYLGTMPGVVEHLLAAARRVVEVANG